MIDPRYPYTYAADLIRSAAGYGAGGAKLSRSDASSIRQAVAAAIGMDDAELARKLADHFCANEDDDEDNVINDFFSARRGTP